MSHGKQKADLNLMVKNQLKSMERYKESKYSDKLCGIDNSGIYSYSTAKAYNRECLKFAAYVKENSPKGCYTSLDEAKNYAKEYIQSHNSNTAYSPYTVKLQAAALAKLFQCKTYEFGPTNSRYRKDITRSRNRTVISSKTGKEILNQSKNAGHFSEKKHEDIVNFVRGTGLRRSELEELKGNQLVIKNNSYYLDVVGKGGKERLIPIIGENKIAIVERCKKAGNGKVWAKVPKAMDVHHYRSQYATNYYKSIARPENELQRKDIYCCRKDLKGTHYDKAAMREVSEALGHNRISVIAEHYLR